MVVFVSDQGGCVFVYKPTSGFVVMLQCFSCLCLIIRVFFLAVCCILLYFNYAKHLDQGDHLSEKPGILQLSV